VWLRALAPKTGGDPGEQVLPNNSLPKKTLIDTYLGGGAFFEHALIFVHVIIIIHIFNPPYS
jgi:hypothetical protein